jgi:hypothetical protein
MSASNKIRATHLRTVTRACQLATSLRSERPDNAYLKELFCQLRAELGIIVPRTPKRLPYVPSEEEIRRYYETVWKNNIARLAWRPPQV